jgi:adenosylcobinamide-GDP ribazoletransferase
MRERENLGHALRFLTILPAGAPQAPDADWLLRCLKYFPLIGFFIGAFSGLVLWLASLVWGSLIAALLAVSISIVLTGALHEDGLADSADALCGSGLPRERRLAIMKDSRLGTYGALALGFGVAFRVASLAALAPQLALFGLIACHAGSRFTAASVLLSQPYVGDRETAKVPYEREKPRCDEIVLALVFLMLAFAPLFYLGGLKSLIAPCVAGLFVLAFLARAKACLQGITGDVLGAAEQMFELGFLLALAASAL